MPTQPAVATNLSPRPAAALSEAERPPTRRLGPVRQWFTDHPRTLDVVVMLWYLVPAATNGIPQLRHTALYLTMVLLGAGALLLRRRWPELVLAITIAAAVVVILSEGAARGPEWAVAFAIYSVASRRSPRRTWVALGLTLLVLAGALALTTQSVDYSTYLFGPEGDVAVVDDEGNIVSLSGELLGPEEASQFDPLPPWVAVTAQLAYVAVLLLIAQTIGTNVRSRRDHAQAVIDHTRRLVLERDQREQLAAATERARIAREMHDVVAHSLSVMIALSDGATASLERRPERTREALEELSETGREALGQMRTILGVLRTEGGDAPFDGESPLAPTTADLTDLVDRFRAAGLPVELSHQGEPLPADPPLAMAVYRVVQESLTNVLRHAPASTTVTVSVTRTEDRVVLEVRNLAPSRTDGDGQGRGLVGMRERVAAYGGTVAAGPIDGGWQVRAELQLPREDEA